MSHDIVPAAKGDLTQTMNAAIISPDERTVQVGHFTAVRTQDAKKDFKSFARDLRMRLINAIPFITYNEENNVTLALSTTSDKPDFSWRSFPFTEGVFERKTLNTWEITTDQNPALKMFFGCSAQGTQAISDHLLLETLKEQAARAQLGAQEPLQIEHKEEIPLDLAAELKVPEQN